MVSSGVPRVGEMRSESAERDRARATAAGSDSDAGSVSAIRSISARDCAYELAIDSRIERFTP